MRYVFDIDGTICDQVEGDYRSSTPRLDRIERVNKLYEEGHFVIFFTARGMGRFDGNALLARLRFFLLTKQQLKAWGARHHKLILGKPAGDIYVDDKAALADDFFS